MRNRKNQISPQPSNEAPLTFSDITACFSEDEWKLLHRWQKELYNNVMKEIHQALTSLGPLIATSVFSLRPEEHIYQGFQDLQDLEIRGSIKHSIGEKNPNYDNFEQMGEELDMRLMEHNDAKRAESSSDNTMVGHPDITPVVSFDIKREDDFLSEGQPNFESITNSKTAFQSHSTEEEPSLRDYHCTEREDKHIFLNTGFPHHSTEEESSLRDYCCTEREESNICINLGPEVTTPTVSFGINEEGEAYAIEMQDYKPREQLNYPVGKGSMNRKRNIRYSSKYNNESRIFKSMPRRLKANVTWKMHERKRVFSQVWPASDEEFRGEEKVQWQTGCQQSTHSSLRQQSETYNKCEIVTINDDFVPRETSPTQHCKPYTCSESEEPGLNNSHNGQKQTFHTKGKHTCTECGKGFNAMSSLVSHHRVHTGERPYHCTTCGKNFSHKGALLRHQQMHTGERPHVCNVCGKSFNQMCHLRRHQQTHTKRQHLADWSIVKV